MPLAIKILPPLDLASTQPVIEQLAAGRRIPSADSMNQLVQSALALRHAAHLARAFTAWLPTMPASERATIRRLLRGLTIESATDGEAFIDDHGGYRGCVAYRLIGSARVVRLEHGYGYDNLEMYVYSNVRFEDLGPSPARKPSRRTDPETLEGERVAFKRPMNPTPAAAMLFKYLGPEETLSAETRMRLLLRLLFPWGRYLHGYAGLPENFYEEADRLYALSRSERARELRARDDDGEVIPFFIR
jgi:hypothetical protein